MLPTLAIGVAALFAVLGGVLWIFLTVRDAHLFAPTALNQEGAKEAMDETPTKAVQASSQAPVTPLTIFFRAMWLTARQPWWLWSLRFVLILMIGGVLSAIYLIIAGPIGR